MSYGECLSIRRRTSKPFILDETIDGTETLIRALAEDAMDIINLKISKVGGLTKARLMRDLCVASGIPMTIEDTWGGDITTAAIAHLAQSTPSEFCFSATDFNSYCSVSIADNSPQRIDGKMAASSRPGLGIDPKFETLGKPVLEVKGLARRVLRRSPSANLVSASAGCVTGRAAPAQTRPLGSSGSFRIRWMDAEPCAQQSRNLELSGLSF